jgi:hypothetical protein
LQLRWRSCFSLAGVVGVGSVATAENAEPAGIWRPAPRTSWQWQLTEPVDLTVPATVFDIDGFDNSAAVVRRLHRLGRKVICYLDVGAFESYRPDAGAFSARLLGRRDEPWPGERWLDIRRIDLLRPIIERRLDMCRDKGFDGVELDEIDGYANNSGFALTRSDQLRYNRFLAREAHDRGLAAGMKNDVEQIPLLVHDFEFAVDEQCFEYHECRSLLPFIRGGKAVFQAEYRTPTSGFCAQSIRLGLSSIRKHLRLDAWRRLCR